MTEPDRPACDSPERVWCQPTLNTPYEPSDRHWQTIDNRTGNEIAPARRKARSRMPLGRVQEPTQTDLYTGDSEIVSRLRKDVPAWRDNHWPRATPPTARLLEYWHAREKTKKELRRILGSDADTDRLAVATGMTSQPFPVPNTDEICVRIIIDGGDVLTTIRSVPLRPD